MMMLRISDARKRLFGPDILDWEGVRVCLFEDFSDTLTISKEKASRLSSFVLSQGKRNGEEADGRGGGRRAESRRKGVVTNCRIRDTLGVPMRGAVEQDRVSSSEVIVR
eukprot:1317578-Amorphochlora_amoeboformis.AAC.1